jgi:hypothetical protein
VLRFRPIVIQGIAFGVWASVASGQSGAPDVATANSGCALTAPGLKPGERTPVLILASPHLAVQVPEHAQREGLNALIDAMARYRPDLIAVESLPAYLIDTYEHAAPVYDDVLRAFAGGAPAIGKAARQSAKLDWRTACARVEALLRSFEGRRADAVPRAERKQAALFLAAAYDLPSAALQWSYLPPEQRVSDADFPSEVADALTRMLASHTELTAVGIALAARMNLQRLYGIDDQSDALFQLHSGQALMGELSQSPEFSRLQDSMLFRELPERIRKHATDGDFLGLYRWMNTPAYAAADVDAQWHFFHRTRLPSGLDRRRAGLWEVRNLRMAANLRAATADAGAKRVLVIIGASHKPFLDAYLRSMMDVVIVDAASFLAP